MLAQLSPLWFRATDPRVAQAVYGDPERINFQPRPREPLMHELGLACD
jgi:alkane 1-monooxygenase